MLQNIFGLCFPCLKGSGNSNDPTKIRISINSNSKCCIKTTTIEISKEHVGEFKSILEEFIKKMETV